MSQKNRHNALLKSILKLAIALALLLWMIESGKLDFGELRIIIERPLILWTTIGIWIVGPVILGSLRWCCLLWGAGYHTPWLHALKLQLIGFFFNSAMPGAVGGDLIKVVYVIRDDQQNGKMAAMMSIILDRIVGLFGLFTVGTIFILPNIHTIWSNPSLKPMVGFIALLMLALIALFCAALFPYREGRDPFLKLLNLSLPGFRILQRTYTSFRLYQKHARYLFYTWILSVIIQFLYFAYFLLLTREMVAGPIDATAIATIFPIGVLTTAVPLAPGGLGVGHVAFDKLFHMIGLSGGANVFNVYVLGQLVLNMIGFFPYILLKRTQPMVQEYVRDTD